MVTAPDGREIGVADFGPPDGVPVVWAHGGPGSRLEPLHLVPAARDAGLRIIGIDRPGYGQSTPQPGRTIAGWRSDVDAVTGHLGIAQFVTVGVSTGGAYAIAIAALEPERVLGVVACAAMTDMRYEPARATMDDEHVHAMWDAPDRDAALAATVAGYGEDGSKLLNGGMNAVLAPSDMETFRDPEWMAAAMQGFPAGFANGPVGYTDDRLADGRGWDTFDVAAITCPVVVLHGDSDLLVDPVHAHHTVSIVPGAELVLHEGLGHFSIEREVVPALQHVLARAARS